MLFDYLESHPSLRYHSAVILIPSGKDTCDS